MTNAEPVVYGQCGLRLRSEIELHLPVVAADRWDVDVVWGGDVADSNQPPPGTVIAASDSEDGRWYTATSTSDGYRLRFHGCGEFVVSADVSEVRVRRDPAGRAELLPVLMAGTTSAFLLALRGHTVLHASAVATNGRALAFVGQSGSGKSTLAALMCIDGAALVTDDVLVVDVDDPVSCVGGASELRLRPGAADIARQPDATTRATADDRLALAAAPASPEPLPLVTIVIPSPSRTASEIEVRRIAPSKALFALLAAPRVHGWRDPQVLERDFTAISRLVNAVPVYGVTIPWGPPFDPSTVTVLARLATGEAESDGSGPGPPTTTASAPGA